MYKVIKPGRPFLQRLIELSTKLTEMHHHLRLNVATRSDLHWWSYYLDHWNGVGLMSLLAKRPPDITVTSDASDPSSSSRATNPNTPRTENSSMPNCSKLDVRKLEETAQGYFDKGLAESTKKSYSSARNRYLAFCTESALDPFPVNEHKLSLFVSYAAQSGLNNKNLMLFIRS